MDEDVVWRVVMERIGEVECFERRNKRPQVLIEK